MRKSAIKLDEDIVRRLNRIKYQWGYKTQSQVIRKLIEIASKFQTADQYAKSSQKNPSTTSFVSSGLKTTSSNSGADNIKKEKPGK